MNTDRDRLLKKNEDEACRIKKELIGFREAMLRHENALNVLAIERTNLEADSEEEKIEIPPELQAFVSTREMVTTPRIWPKIALGAFVIACVLIGLGALGIFDTDGGAPIAHRVVIPTPSVVAPSTMKGSAMKGNGAAIIKSSSIPLSTHTTLTTDRIRGIPIEGLINILPGITYTSEISYSMKSSTITLVKVNDEPLITLQISHTPQSFFIPLRTPFRIDSERIDEGQRNGKLMVISDSKKHDLEIRYEPRVLPLERKILGVSSSQ